MELPYWNVQRIIYEASSSIALSQYRLLLFQSHNQTSFW